MSQQCVLRAPKANRVLGCIQSSVGSRTGEGILSLYSAPPGELQPALGLSAQEGQPVGVSPEEATKLIRRMEHLSYEERLGQLGLFRMEKRRLWDDLIVAFKYLKEAYKKDGEGLFVRASSDRTRGNGSKLKDRFRVYVDVLIDEPYQKNTRLLTKVSSGDQLAHE
ncbi:hypothetical protein WISP_57545 [Willisornis vidua]|uniref:Uncharacterized protein n=1 Tax=Willisornis vidua TaxID=1566151 RepID=A0ABQ9DGN3_9PASS|nr:hypothetical protein WISP_57545 [Willisornis vidua]